MIKPKFEYGGCYSVKPTRGIDCPRGDIVITGIVHPANLPKENNLAAWETGDAEFDWDLNNRPWYYFEYCYEDEYYNFDENFVLPEFALEEIIDAAERESQIDYSEQNAIR